MLGLSKKKTNRVLEVVLVTAFAIVLAYIVSVTVKVTSGVSKTIETPSHLIRLQVLNGCGVKGLASRVADDLARYTDKDLEIMIVDTDNFAVREVLESFLISRTEDLTEAELLADRLGLDQSAIVYRELENNHRHVSVTLVLGADHEGLRLTDEITEEN